MRVLLFRGRFRVAPSSYIKLARAVYRQIIWSSTWDFQQCVMCDQQILSSACAYAVWSELMLVAWIFFECKATDWAPFLSLKGGCTGSSESALVKMPHCWKSHTAAPAAQIYNYLVQFSGMLHCWLQRYHARIRTFGSSLVSYKHIPIILNYPPIICVWWYM